MNVCQCLIKPSLTKNVGKLASLQGYEQGAIAALWSCGFLDAIASLELGYESNSERENH